MWVQNSMQLQRALEDCTELQAEFFLGRKGKAAHAIAYFWVLDINMLGRKQCNTQELAHFLQFWGLGIPLDFFLLDFSKAA